MMNETGGISGPPVSRNASSQSRSRPTWTYAVKWKSDLCAGGSVGDRPDCAGKVFVLNVRTALCGLLPRAVCRVARAAGDAGVRQLRVSD